MVEEILYPTTWRGVHRARKLEERSRNDGSPVGRRNTSANGVYRNGFTTSTFHVHPQLRITVASYCPLFMLSKGMDVLPLLPTAASDYQSHHLRCS